MPAKKLACALLVLGTFLSAKLNARSLALNSIESLTCASQIVAIGTLKEIKSVKGPDNRVFKDYVLTVSEIIKGSHAKEISFTYDDPYSMDGKWRKPDQPLLVFLRQQQDHLTDEQDRPPTEDHDFRETRLLKRLILVSDNFFPSVIPLADLPGYLYDKDKHQISDGQTLLAICRQWASSPIKQTVRWVQVDPDVLSPFIPYSLIVPAEEKHRLLFLQHAKSDDPTLRQTAAEELWKFPGDESETALRSLLNDTTESIWSLGRGYISRIEYRVRSAAVSSLKKLGEPVPDLLLQRPPTAEEKRKYRQDAWQQSFQGALAKQPWKVAALRNGEVHTKDSVDWTIQEVDLTQGEDKCTLRLVPDTFGTGFGGTMKYIGRENPSNSCSHLFYASPSISPDLEKKLVSYFGLEAPH
ncbi:HEAT repeat domain-containing protein [Prosthecobacter sp.]|uniref:HEAT repeat domain-containing protein n=1 Tax=Prosthecobacter sp. TaxID=1965333 RepID=UPI0037846BAB